MTKNGLDIQTISPKRTEFQSDRVLLLGQVTEKKEKDNPSHFLKFPFAIRTNGTFGFAPTHTCPEPSEGSQHYTKSKEPFFAKALTIIRIL